MASVRKRGDTFTISVSLGYDELGKQIRKFTTYTPPADVSAGKAEKLAVQYAAIWEDKIRGYTSLDENRTFRELAQWYYETVAPSVLKDNVLFSNKLNVDSYAMPTLGNVKLKNITPTMLDVLFAELRKSGKVIELYRLRDTSIFPKQKKAAISRATGISRKTITRASFGDNVERGVAEKIAAYFDKPLNSIFVADDENGVLSQGSIIRIKNCVSAIFTAAVKREIMRRNPCFNITSLTRSRAATSFLDETQAVELLAALDRQDNFQFRVMISMLLFTGMRAGEMLGLMWPDVDFDKDIVYIRRTLAYNVNHKANSADKYSLQTPKTATSERYIRIPALLVELLKEHRQRQDETRAGLGVVWAERGTVFANMMGDYFSEAYLNQKFKTLCAKLEFPPGVHIHTLRHTAASLLINSDVSPKLIAEQLGHKEVSTTTDIYSHVFASSKARTMQALESKLTRGAGV